MWAIEEIDAAANRDIYRTRLDYYLTLLGRSDIDGAHFKALSASADRIIELIHNTYRPKTVEVSINDERQAATRGWVEAYGDPRVPAVKAKIDATVAALMAMDVSSKPATVTQNGV